MIFRNRAMAYVSAGAAGIFAAGAFAAPALAADSADLAIEATGTTIALGAEKKDATVSLINKSTVDAKGILVGLDVSKLDTKLVDIDESGCSPREEGIILCGIESDTLGAGEDIDWGFTLTRAADAKPGDAGEITAFIEHEGTDPDETNNKVTVKVSIAADSGPDLVVVAEDVRQAAKVVEGNPSFSGSLYAGGQSALTYFIGNQGDVATTGLKINVKLPKGVTPAETEEGCEYAADKSSFTCTYDDFGLIPRDQDTKGDDDLFSAYGFYHLINVGADVKPGALTGGMVTVEPIVERAIGAKSVTRAELPANVEGLQAADVDASDNTDAYAVLVAAKGGAGGGDTDGGLPVTGPQAGLLGGIGAAVLAAGGAMFLVARRRRVVLVAPGDEKPTA